MEETASLPAAKPLWRRIVDYPLVAMVIAMMIVFVCFTVGFLIGNYALPPIPGFGMELKFELASIPLLILAYLFVIRRLGERPRNDYRDPKWMRRLGLGLLAGLLVFSTAVGIAALLGVYDVTGEGDLSGLLPALIGPTLFAAISEEMVFRGILFRWIEEWAGSWTALLLTSAFFGASHLLNPNASPIAAVGIAFEAGVMLGAAYMLTRSLWLPMGIHAAWNFTQGEVYDIPVSGMPVHGMVQAHLSGPPLLTGNGFGLEASIIAIVVATLFGVWLLWMAIKQGEVMQPRWVRRRRAAAIAVAA
jgi:membrane protease YdiL (CAAX protease family)